MRRKRKTVGLGALIALCLLSTTPSRALADEATQSYVEIFTTGTEEEQRQALERLAWAGESDPALFDLIEAQALAGYPGLKGRDSKMSEIKRVSRYVQASPSRDRRSIARPSNRSRSARRARPSEVRPGRHRSSLPSTPKGTS